MAYHVRTRTDLFTYRSPPVSVCSDKMQNLCFKDLCVFLMEKVEIELPQSLMSSHSVREPREDCSSSQTILCIRDSPSTFPSTSLKASLVPDGGGEESILFYENTMCLGSVGKWLGAAKCLTAKPDLPQYD